MSSDRAVKYHVQAITAPARKTFDDKRGNHMTKISGYHHLTLSTDGVQEDYDFYTKTLGLYSVKRTVLFDGVLPV